jgi:hypothetical protein
MASYEIINVETAAKIIDKSQALHRGKKKDELLAEHFLTTKSNECILSFETTLQRSQWERMLSLADEIEFWHYNYNPECNQSIDMKIGHVRYSITFSKIITPDEIDGLSTEVVE